MKQFALQKYSFGDFLGIVGDAAHPPLAEARRRIDADGDMPRLLVAAGVKPLDNIVDAGGFIGDTAWALAQTGAKVTVFEPFLDAYTAMLYNTRNLPRVCCLNAPTGNGELVKLVYECPGPNFGMRSVEPVDIEQPLDRDEVVKTCRIDDLNLETCKLIKIDVEGAEISTLRGAEETIKRCRPFLYVEMYADALAKRGATPEDLERTLKDLGYKLEMWGEPPRWDWLATPL